MATSKSFETWIAGAFLYSGRADPTWPVSRGFAKRFENLWSMLPATEKAAPNPSRLGYRGAFLRVSLHQQWIAFGGVEDASLNEQIARLAGSNVVNVAGKTTLRELMALLKLCRVLLTNDSGPMHVAAAFGTPVVVPFGSTSPELTGPGLPGDARHFLLRANVPCSPCFRRTCPIDLRCMTGITVTSVVEAVLQAASAKR